MLDYPTTIEDMVKDGVMYPFLIRKAVAVYDPEFNLQAPIGTILVVMHRGTKPNTFVAYKDKIPFEIKDHKAWVLHMEGGDNVIPLKAFKARRKNQK
jgi:hypothetical protein